MVYSCVFSMRCDRCFVLHVFAMSCQAMIYPCCFIGTVACSLYM